MTIEVPPELDADARALLAVHAHATLVDAPALAGRPGDPLLAATPFAPPAVLAARYRKDLARLDAEVERSAKKLGNEQFAAKAAPDVVAKERAKLADYEAERERVRGQLAVLDAGDSAAP
jgi:hypothetical protein